MSSSFLASRQNEVREALASVDLHEVGQDRPARHLEQGRFGTSTVWGQARDPSSAVEG